ncbi:MAG: trimethylamine methyltransferase family protein, partial [Thermoleophilia bacterium]
MKGSVTFAEALIGCHDVELMHESALDLLGADADAALRAVKLAPGGVTLAGRDVEFDVVLDRGACVLAAGGAATRVLSLDGSSVRDATLDDLANACCVADSLPEVGFLYGPPVSPSDVTISCQIRTCLEQSAKHLQLVGLSDSTDAQTVVGVAEAWDVGARNGRTRPRFSLCTDADGVASAIVFARAGLPVALSLGPREPLAPDASLGTVLAHHHAGVLAACRLIQEEVPGAAFIYAPPSLPVNSGQVSTSTSTILGLGAAMLAQKVGLPVAVISMVSAAAVPGWRACTDKALASLPVAGVGGASVLGAGALEWGATFSLQQLVMDAEVFSWNRRIGAGIPINDDAIAVQEIRTVGIGGNHLARRHTRQRMRDVWRPRLLDRSAWDAWEESGKR